jgi:hypothetical protein
MVEKVTAEAETELGGRQVDAGLGERDRARVVGDLKRDKGKSRGRSRSSHPNLRTGTPYFHDRLSRPSSNSHSSFG